jgi:hypothetical protein
MLKKRAQTTKPKLEKPQRTSPCTHASSPWTNATPPGRIHAKHHLKQGSCNNIALTGQTSQHHWSDWCATCEQGQHSTGQTDDLDRSDRCTPEPRNGSKPPENLLNASIKPFQAQTSPPCWQCMNQAKNAKFST